MMLLASNAMADALNSREWIFPLAECVHIAGFGVAIGTIAVLDLRLLGLGLGRHTSAELAEDLAPWTMASLVITITAGLMLFLSQTFLYAGNPAFHFKMWMLAAAIVYHYTLHRKVASRESSGIVPKAAAIVSLGMWVSVVGGGLFTAFV